MVAIETVKLRPDEVFSSRGRTRILMILAKHGELNISAIAQKANLNYATAFTHLKALEEANIIHCKRFGRIKIYRFNENEEGELCKTFLKKCGLT